MKRNNEGAEVERVEDLGLTVQSSGYGKEVERSRLEQMEDGFRCDV